MKIEDFLKRLRLNVYEKAAYLALSKIGEAKAAELCRLANVPYGRIYDSLAHLEQLGLISVLPSQPKIYKIIPPKKAFKLILQQERRELQQLEQQVARIEIKTTEKRIPPELLIIRGRAKYHELTALMSNTVKSELLIAIEKAEGQTAPLRFPVLRAIERGVKVKLMLAKITAESKENIKELKANGAEVRVIPFSNLRLLIKDRNETILSIVEESKDRTSIYSANKDFAKSMASFFDALWQRSQKI